MWIQLLQVRTYLRNYFDALVVEILKEISIFSFKVKFSKK